MWICQPCVYIVTMLHGTYGINGKSYGCALYPAEKPRFGRANRWILRQHEDELAVIQRSPLRVEASLPVHLGAVLLSFVLVRYGLPEESVPRGDPSAEVDPHRFGSLDEGRCR